MRFVLAALIVIFWGTTTHAERRVALVFGTDRYETIRPLVNAVNDARAVEETLEALNFEVFSETNRDLKRMRRALEDFEEDAAGADVALVFFAGHGVEVAGDNRLLPTDVDTSSMEALRETSLALNELQQVANRVAETALIILDACRDDPFAIVSDPSGRGVLSMSLPETVQPGLGRMGQSDNTLFAFSAAPGKTASDGDGNNSPFTSALTRYLDTEGLEIRSVLTLVQQEVYDRTRGQQLPYVESGLPTMFFASQTSIGLEERERLLLAMANIDDSARRDVERVAIQADVPLAPLYGALIGSGLAELDRQQRSKKLQEAASAFSKVRNELRTLRSGDEQVTALRQEAEKQLSLGSFELARAKLTEAAEIDASSREVLQANLIERTLSEAATHYLNGGAALAELEYRLAIVDYKKAVSLLGEVQDQLMPTDSRKQQLSALGALGKIAITTGSLPDATEAFETQIEVSKTAVKLDPDNAELQLALGLSYDNLGDVLFEQGLIAEALLQYQAGHQVRLSLSDKSTDEELKFALSKSYERLGLIYHRQGDLITAEEFYLEKYRLGTEMAALESDGYKWARDLSISDELLGDVLREKGDLRAALGHYQAGLDRMVPIRDANPEDLGLKRFTSITLDRLGEVFALQRELPSARSKFEESLKLRVALVDADPANVDWQYVLGISHERLGDVLVRLGDKNNATAAYEAKHQIISNLAESDPTNVRWQRDLSVADERLGKLAQDRGDFDRAITYFQSSLHRMKQVREASPTDMELNRFVSFTQDHVASVLVDKEEFGKALDLYHDSRIIRERLVEFDPDNGDWRFILGISHERIGNAYMRMQRPESAVASYKQELEIMSVLLEKDPQNSRWRRVVSTANELLGDAYLATGVVSEALTQYGTSLKRMSNEREKNPDNLAIKRFLAVTNRKIGEAHLSADESAAALSAFVESLDLARQLVSARPQNAKWQRDLMLAYKGVADAGNDIEQNLERALEVAEVINDLGRLDTSDEALVSRLKERLEILQQ